MTTKLMPRWHAILGKKSAVLKVARVLGVDKVTVYRWEDRGHWPRSVVLLLELLEAGNVPPNVQQVIKEVSDLDVERSWREYQRLTPEQKELFRKRQSKRDA